MKSILLSVQPKWLKKILSGEKTIEVRKSAPKELPFKVYVYCTKGKKGVLFKSRATNEIRLGFERDNSKEVIDILNKSGRQTLNGKVVAEFVCMNVETFNVGSLRCDDIEKLACLTYKEMVNYFYKPIELNGNTQKWGKALHITDLKIYDEPKELGEFKTVKFVRRYQRKNETKFEKLQHSKRVEVKYITRPPQSWQYCEELE